MISLFGGLIVTVLTFIFVTVGLFVAVKLFQGLGHVLRTLVRGIAFGVKHIARFVKSMVLDTINFAGSLFTAVVILMLTVVNLLFGRLESAKHYGRAFETEVTGSLKSLYRIALGNPMRLAFLGPIASRFERRVPKPMHRAPSNGSRQPGVFEGYEVLGTLPSGGSGAQLFVARPRASHAAELASRHANVPDRVVIKSFMLGLGSTLPQMIREGRALEAARRLGLLVEHQLSETSFYYVMPYVDGEELGRMTDTLHGEAPSEGLSESQLRLVLGWSADVLRTLERFHTGGLWHKDIKPANVLVASGRAHLVDFGLVTPLASGMTLTTHGTEYYRDPEMVRLAMRGVKVHEVDGVKFDLYSAGALLFSMVEGQFPAHGSLSQLSKRCPESLRYIIRRSMADLESRYSDARSMRADLEAVRTSADPFAMRPIDLPSMGGETVALDDNPLPSPATAFVAASETPEPVATPSRRSRKVRRVVVPLVAASVVAFMIMEESKGGNSGAHARHETARTVTVVHRDPNTGEVQGVVAVAFDQTVPAPLLQVIKQEGFQPNFLVLSDSISWARHGGYLSDMREAYEAQGFRVLDRALDNESGRATDVDLIAGATNAVQFRTPDDDEAIADLRDFLDDTEELDGILWVVSGPNGAPRTVSVYRSAWEEIEAPKVRALPSGNGRTIVRSAVPLPVY